MRVGGPRPRPPAPQRVLRERRQAHQRRGDHPPDHPGVLPRAPGLRAGAPLRPLAQPAGPAHRADGQAPRLRPLRAGQLAGRPAAARRGAEGARLPRRGRLLHLGPGQQRGRLRPPALLPRLRHQQPARLLQHVPRVERFRAPRDAGHRQGHGQPRRPAPRRPDLPGGAEPGHQPSAPALGAGAGQAERRPHRGGEHPPRGRAHAVQEPAEAARARRQGRRDRRPFPAHPPRRRPRPLPGAEPAAAGGRGRPAR